MVAPSLGAVMFKGCLSEQVDVDADRISAY
jgi:hypothetical protein